MPKKPDETFQIPRPKDEGNFVLDLLGGVVRKRPLSGEEALKQEAQFELDAKLGNPQAITHVAGKLLRDEPQAEKNRRAIRLLKRGLKTNYPPLIHLYAICALRGQGMAKNIELGLSYLTQSAIAGYPQSEYDLGRAYLLGIVGGAPNISQALIWFRLAGAAGISEASLEAARIYKENHNYDEANKWYNLAASSGIVAAQYELSLLHVKRDYANRDRQQARRWMAEAAISGNAEAQYRLGIFCWSGSGGKVAIREAVRWLIRASEQYHAQSISMLAGFFLTGNGLEYNQEKAYTLYLVAKACGDKSADLTLNVIKPMLTHTQISNAQLNSTTPIKKLLEELIPRTKR